MRVKVYRLDPEEGFLEILKMSRLSSGKGVSHLAYSEGLKDINTNMLTNKNMIIREEVLFTFREFSFIDKTPEG